MAENILNGMFLRPLLGLQDDSYVDEISADRPCEELSIDDMRTWFPHLVRNGDYVKAMEIIHGHSRFNWFYELFCKISECLFCRNQNR